MAHLSFCISNTHSPVVTCFAHYKHLLCLGFVSCHCNGNYLNLKKQVVGKKVGYDLFYWEVIPNVGVDSTARVVLRSYP